VETKLGLLRAAVIVWVAGFLTGLLSYLAIEIGLMRSISLLYVDHGAWILVLWSAITAVVTGAVVAAGVRWSGFTIGVVESTFFVLLGQVVSFGLIFEAWKHAPGRDELLVVPFNGGLGIVGWVLGIMIPAWLVNSVALPPGMRDLPDAPDAWPVDFVPPDVAPTDRRY
jgi:hypothetical protein